MAAFEMDITMAVAAMRRVPPRSVEPQAISAKATTSGGAMVTKAARRSGPAPIDVVRRTDLDAGDLREHEEAAVFADDENGVAERPAVVVGQPALEGERIARCGKRMGLDARQQFGGGGSALVVRVTGDGSLPFLLLWVSSCCCRECRRTCELPAIVENHMRKSARPNDVGRGRCELKRAAARDLIR